MGCILIPIILCIYLRFRNKFCRFNTSRSTSFCGIWFEECKFIDVTNESFILPFHIHFFLIKAVLGIAFSQLRARNFRLEFSHFCQADLGTFWFVISKHRFGQNVVNIIFLIWCWLISLVENFHGFFRFATINQNLGFCNLNLKTWSTITQQLKRRFRMTDKCLSQSLDNVLLVVKILHWHLFFPK